MIWWGVPILLFSLCRLPEPAWNILLCLHRLYCQEWSSQVKRMNVPDLNNLQWPLQSSTPWWAHSCEGFKRTACAGLSYLLLTLSFDRPQVRRVSFENFEVVQIAFLVQQPPFLSPLQSPWYRLRNEQVFQWLWSPSDPLLYKLQNDSLSDECKKFQCRVGRMPLAQLRN